MEIRHECTLIHFALECKATYQIPTDSLNPMRTAIATIQYCLLADCSILSWSGPIGLPATHLLAEDKYGTWPNTVQPNYISETSFFYLEMSSPAYYKAFDCIGSETYQMYNNIVKGSGPIIKQPYCMMAT